MSGVATKKGRTALTVILNYQELRKTPLLLGEFLYLRSGTYYPDSQRTYFVMVTDAYYKPVAYGDHARALALGHLNEEDLDENSVRQMNFLHYDVVVLGETRQENGSFRFFPSTRVVPSLVDVKLEFVPSNELESIINTSLSASENAAVNVPLGHLQYGSSPEATNSEVRKLIDVSCFRSRRTANFGKTGLGKSNENKVILTLLKSHFPASAAIIFDLNGEYATQTSSSTAIGLYEVFQKLSITGQLVWYTNRKNLKLDSNYVEVRTPRIDFFDFPDLAIELAYQRGRLESGRVPQYLESVHLAFDEIKAVDNRLAYVYGALLKAGLTSNKVVRFSNQSYNLHSESGDFLAKLEAGSQKADKGKEQDENGEQGKSSTRDIFRYAKRLSFLRDFHQSGQGEDFFQRTLADVESGKIVVIDLPSLRPEAVEFVSTRIGSRIFERAQSKYAEGAMFEVLLLIEEAHNLLRDPEGIFYRIAKEGRKYGLGLLYSTQSPSGIAGEILSQTENFFVKHVSSQDDVTNLANAKVVFGPPIADFLLNEPVVGMSYVYMEPYQPFPVPVAVRLLEDVVASLAQKSNH